MISAGETIVSSLGTNETGSVFSHSELVWIDSMSQLGIPSVLTGGVSVNGLISSRGSGGSVV